MADKKALSTSGSEIDVSIILPIHNAERWLDDCLASVHAQEFDGHVELSVYDDGCTDSSMGILSKWKPKLEDKGFSVLVGSHSVRKPKGVGFAKNRAIERSCGRYLCFLDADDTMHKHRVKKQYQAAKEHPDAIVGCRFHREPENSTERYSKWANRLSASQLYTQVYTSHGPTVIMPTWFMSRHAFNKIGHFDESGKGTPEDLIFFYKHLEVGGRIHCVEEDLLMYRYHPDAETFSVMEDTIWNLRVQAIQQQVLSKWSHFSIWNAGKQGRRLYRSLSKANQDKVTCFCDVDAKKISKGCYIYEDSPLRPKPRVPIVHFSKAQPPFIICVKQDLTGGGFETNLASLKLNEGLDYFHFN